MEKEKTKEELKQEIETMKYDYDFALAENHQRYPDLLCKPRGLPKQGKFFMHSEAGTMIRLNLENVAEKITSAVRTWDYMTSDFEEMYVLAMADDYKGG